MQETNIFLELEKRQALTDLVFSALDNLKTLVKRVDLREINQRKVCVIVFNHQVGLNEFKYKEEQILNKMRILYKERNLKDWLSFSKVLAEVSFKPTLKETKKQEKQTYKERATGNFEIKCKNTELAEYFKRIQNIIKEHNNG
ncbi:hypothetical protein B6S12_10090 [Helicobacter valdiviensis]|uniref:Uncharacterized protein n=1 Tax=Helicobacter valdiviensis TaxID=1458358 RepID=A0A2W6MRR0_9HELI|nr:hypothetical protein [Helicobacter valdiviensis]PZT47245.1 hypothetical protein B6S12_10090 [Helicobacter valdiviensis]